MLPTSAAVSSCMRIANTGPIRLTRLLVIAVTMISRRSWCFWMSRGKRRWTGSGK